MEYAAILAGCAAVSALCVAAAMGVFTRYTIVLDLGAADKITARRVIDFLSGVAYARGGSLSRISGGVYLVTPAGVNITGEMMSQIESGGLYF